MKRSAVDMPARADRRSLCRAAAAAAAAGAPPGSPSSSPLLTSIGPCCACAQCTD